MHEDQNARDNDRQGAQNRRLRLAIVKCQNGNYTAYNVTDYIDDCLAGVLRDIAQREPACETIEACVNAPRYWFNYAKLVENVAETTRLRERGDITADFAIYTTGVDPAHVQAIVESLAKQRETLEAALAAIKGVRSETDDGPTRSADLFHAEGAVQIAFDALDEAIEHLASHARLFTAESA